MHRHLHRMSFAAVALVALAGVAPAMAAEQGTFSIGGTFGTGIYSNSKINDGLDPGVDKVSSGWEYGGSLRYQASPRLALDLGATMMVPKSTTPATPDDIVLSTPGTAVPLSLYYTVSENDQYRFNMFGGAGMVFGAKGKEEGGGSPAVESESASAFYGHGGVEAQWMVSPQFALGARVLGRTAKATVKGATPDDDLEIDYSGVAFGLGAQMMFGGVGH